MFPLLVILIAQAAGAVSVPRAVPYLPQTEALCGGAAAAMVMRYWGAADARPESFASLIDPAQDGIVTTALVGDLRARGWQAFPLRGSREDAGPLRQHLARGRPLIALIEDRPSRYHYVVITAVDDTRVHFHDPAKAPSQTMTWAEFERRWRAANFWMLLLLPRESTSRAPAEESRFATEIAALLRGGETEKALQLATDATKSDPSSAVAWDAKATSLFVMDRELDALDAWNRAGKPDIDTAQIAGLTRTRFRAAEQLIGLDAGDRLTAAALARARRRLAMLPSATSSRVGYAPMNDGRVQIDAAIVERSRVPGVADLLMAGAKAPFSRDVELSLTNLAGGGERVTGAWRFREGFERVAASVETPALFPLGAAWKISGEDARETYRVRGAVSSERRQRASFQAADWITSWLGWTAAAGFDRWPAAAGDLHREKFTAAARASVAAGSWFDAHVTAEGWMRGDGATRLSGAVRAEAPVFGGALALTAGAQGVHGRAPVFLWPGAGDGHIRAPLLRGHPLVRDGAISVDEGALFGRRLIHGTAEWTVPFARLALLELGGALFVDAARAWQLLDGRLSDHQVDAGVGLRFRLLGGGPTLRIDVSDRHHFSINVSASTGLWIW